MAKFDEQTDRLRVSKLFDFDKTILEKFTHKEDGLILGIDEVGRGPVAGPVAAGGVVFDKGCYIKWLNDSKKITEKRRPLVAKDIKENSIFSHVEVIDASIIDELGIVQCLMNLFSKLIASCEAFGVVPDAVLVDGNNVDLCDDRVECVVKADSKSACVAAASVIAKVERDELMTELSKQYPEYDWQKNKGYGTEKHLEVIKNYGICKYHRRSFLTKYL